MILSTEQTSGGDGPAFTAEPTLQLTLEPVTPAPGGAPDEAGTDALWTIAAAVWRRRWWIAAFTVVAAGAAVAFALRLPNYYTSEARVMLPNSGGSSMSSLIESVAPGTSGLLGGGGGDYTRYLAILTSRTVAERAVQRFGLVEVYETAEKPSPAEAAINEFRKNATFNVSLEYNYLAIDVRDQSPRRAAQIANYLVGELNTENTRLSSESASERRQFIETRLHEAEAALDSVQVQMQGFQERYGITEPEVQGQALMGSIASASAAVAQAEIYLASLVSAYGDTGENPEVNSAKAALAAARQQMERLTSGNNAMMPVPLERLPQVGRQYAQLKQEQLVQAQIIEFVRPMYEQASFSERQQTSAVQVIDEAVEPVKKSDPRRSVIVIGITLSALVLALAFVAGRALLRVAAPHLARRMVRAEETLAEAQQARP